MSRKWVSLLALPLLLMATAADCKDNTGSGGGSVSNEGGRGFSDPNPGQQPPPPVADPGPQNEPGHALFQVVWIGERSGHVEFTINSGPAQKKDCPAPTKDKNGKYRGLCTWAVATQKGTTIGFTWFPKAPGMFAQCILQANGTQQDYQHVQSGSCAVSWVVS